ncbi:PQQ-dependent sugar dehydrogenase [Roseomonas stagni]|uniref:PQQ-dependent sugar dehydrogenase n=2 Tax=Falsiroseomonas algicola TaxID=2716930 RepID=A0A6M1LUX3_9PROT|nr:PQQ-dependent sugar dehydrogenase [Falsiroseomonas algicola]
MRRMMNRRTLLTASLAALPLPALAQSGDTVRSDRAAFRLTTLATGLDRPWGAALLPDGSLLVTERPGGLRRVTPSGEVSAPLAGVPEVEARGQGGMLDIAIAPDFARTREVYLSHAMLVQGGALTRLTRARLSADATALEGVTPILDATPAQPSGRNHYGSRIAFGPDGRLYLSTGDRMNDKMRSQRLDDLAGKILRLERDGSAAAGNPFLGRGDARAEIFSYGHRNPQGLAFNPWTGGLWQAEFGARGGDEINLVRPGLNYGWPVVSHGVDYNGSPIGTGQKEAPGIEAPLHFWTPSVSPSGINFYTGNAFPGWSRSLFVAALNPPGLVRLETEGERVVAEERLLFDRRIRMRQVVVAADGALLVLTDEGRGRILRLIPA